MAIKDLKKILEQVHEFNEFKLEEVNSRHPKYQWLQYRYYML